MLYVLNQKSHFTKQEILKYRQKLSHLPLKENVIFAPSMCFLPFFENFSLCAQDVSPFPTGAYTGEEAAKSLASLGVSYGIVGHSERRTYFNENNELLEQKMAQIFNAGMTPILCIGESLEDYQQGNTKEVLQKQLQVLFSFPQEMWKKAIIAYEPIWAIGTGKVIDVKLLEEITLFIKQQTGSRVLYGGSIQLTKIHDFQKIPTLDGFLIGGMSLQVDDVIQLIQNA